MTTTLFSILALPNKASNASITLVCKYDISHSENRAIVCMYIAKIIMD
jgi:hypothetical protein